ncbi:MAG: hypothetical protein J0I42_17885 [Bosea sp.]|uniref:hypothetical protein n=1 Tax=Bosea sp. (in: a-proteobacteria) TaxID=1871050 RepID=UPI001AD2D039|nr:hypothetical protein [Bosea sp. (in: a-proteobacteria)]MBN9453813.1 hypothetical protein [Bosea sp. (in: a-proteobacteria)]
MAIDLTEEERSQVAHAAAADGGFRGALLSALPYLGPAALLSVCAKIVAGPGATGRPDVA